MSTHPTNNRKTSPLVIIAVIAVLAMIGIYASNDDDAPTSSTPTATVTPQIEPDVATDAGAPDAAAGVPTAVVPDVVGMNHQAAQDTLQAAGFYLLHEEDATGQGRMLILDRNWEVVAQSTTAGTTAPTDTWITLSSKKIGE